MSPSKVRFQEKIFAIKNFMHSRHLASDLEVRVTNYMNGMWNKYEGEWMPGSPSIIQEIPLLLQQDIAVEDKFEIVNQVSLFVCMVFHGTLIT